MKLKKSIVTALFMAAFMLIAASVGAASGIILNGDFESGLSDWEPKAYIDEGAVIDTASDPEMGAVAHISAASDNDVRLIQRVAVKENTCYKISCRIKTSGTENGAGGCIGIYGLAVSSEPCLGDADWHYIELTGRTAAGQTELPVTIGVGSHGALSSGEAWFDDVRIEETDSASVKFGKDPASKDKSAAGAKDANGPKETEDIPTEFPTDHILTLTALAFALTVAFAAWHFIAGGRSGVSRDNFKKDIKWVVLILVLALAARIVISLLVTCRDNGGRLVYGHKIDANDFIFWGNSMVKNGAGHFYDGWCDYPPGYMLVLGFMTLIRSIFGLNDPYANALFIKIPCIIADLACAYIVYRIARKKMNRSAALALMALVAFTPVFAYISAGWAQIDQVLALTLIVPILLLYDRHPVWAGLIYGCGILMKPQALMCGPLFAAAYLIYVFRGCPYKEADFDKGLKKLIGIKKDSIGFRFAETILAVLAAVGVIILVAIPFTGAEGSQGTLWLVEKYYNTATSYDYATVNAYNYWAYIGANWAKTSTPYLGLTYGQWGTIGMAASVILSLGLYVFAALKHKTCKGALPLTMAFMLSGIFTFGHFMHERYVFPALMLLMIAYLMYNDWRILVIYVIYAASVFCNCLAAFYYSALHQYGLYWDEALVHGDSLVNLIIFGLLAYTTFDLVFRNKPWNGFKPFQNDETLRDIKNK